MANRDHSNSLAVGSKDRPLSVFFSNIFNQQGVIFWEQRLFILLDKHYIVDLL